MFDWLKRRRAKQHLAPVVGAVPASLARMFGPAPTYTSAQVLRATDGLRLDRPRAETAIAACCAEGEFLAALPDWSAEDYRRLRREIAETFEIDRPKFNCEHLLALKYVPYSSAWTPNRTEYDHGG